MAAASPTAVATSASAMPGATASMEPPPEAKPEKASMMPQTVPNKPMKGATEPMVASVAMRRSSFSWAWDKPSLRARSTGTKFWPFR